MYTNKEFGLRLKKLRMEAHETQKQLAELLGVTQNQIGEMEHGRKASTYGKLTMLPQTICCASPTSLEN